MTRWLLKCASVSAARLKRPAEKEDRGAGDEEHEFAPHVAAEDAVEERDTGDEETGELERSREQYTGAPCWSYGVSATTTRVMRSPCSIRLTTSCPATTWPKTV